MASKTGGSGGGGGSRTTGRESKFGAAIESAENDFASNHEKIELLRALQAETQALSILEISDPFSEDKNVIPRLDRQIKIAKIEAAIREAKGNSQGKSVFREQLLKELGENNPARTGRTLELARKTGATDRSIKQRTDQLLKKQADQNKALRKNIEGNQKLIKKAEKGKRKVEPLLNKRIAKVEKAKKELTESRRKLAENKAAAKKAQADRISKLDKQISVANERLQKAKLKKAQLEREISKLNKADRGRFKRLFGLS